MELTDLQFAVQQQNKIVVDRRARLSEILKDKLKEQYASFPECMHIEREIENIFKDVSR